MPTNKPIQSVVVTSAVSSITFSGIDQSYTDLLITANFTLSTANASVFMRFNGDTTTAYSDTSISGTGSALWTDRDSNATQIRVSAQRTAQSATDRQAFTININDYNNTTNYKTCLSRYGSVGGVEAFAGQWRNTAAINSITLGFGSSYTFSPGTIVSLYGIKSGAPQALGGDVVVTDGNYWYHAFRSSGTFTAQRPMSADVLTIAGGGSGAENNAGGGAGGLLYSASQLLSPTNYTVTIGAGAAGRAAASGLTGINGSNSVFGTLTAIGGGGGQNGTVGGSGGGASSVRTQGTSGQGNAGGLSGPASDNYTGGGGGGAGQQGGDGQATVSGKGGDGVDTYSSWASATGTGANSGYYAGGGAGGWFSNTNTGSSGGAGLGGGGNSGRPGSDGTANTGGGGAGGTRSVSGTNYASTNGGSGLVIVRYPV
jgi:hypothetical protein